MDAERSLQGIGERTRGAEFSQRDCAGPQASNTRRHRGTVSANRHASPFRGRGSARRNCCRAAVDARNGRATLTQMDGRTYHTSAPLLRCSHGTARFEYKGGGHELDFVWRLIL